MSLYILGAIISVKESLYHKERMDDLCRCVGVFANFDSLDDDDKAIINENTSGFFEGSIERDYFSLSERPDEADATSLWGEAQRWSMHILRQDGVNTIPTLSTLEQVAWPNDFEQEMQNCRLGKLISELRGVVSSDAVVAICFIDGGIEQVKIAPIGESITEILRSMLLPWDCLSNTLYVCKP